MDGKPAELAEEIAATDADASSWDQLVQMPRRLLIAGAALVGIAATLLDAFGLQAFHMDGALTIIGILIAAIILLFSFTTQTTTDLSRAPAAAADALDALPAPCYVTDRRGAVLFANEAYRRLLGVSAFERPPPLERLLAGREGMAEGLFRLAKAARIGIEASEEIHLSRISDRNDKVYEVTVRPLADNSLDPNAPKSSAAGGAVWLLRDLTSDRERAEAAEREWNRIFSFLAATPLGFYSAETTGKITYINATLAGWLGVEPPKIIARHHTLADFALGDISNLLNASDFEGTVIRDVDLRGPGGNAVPVRIVQTLVGGPGGEPLCCGLVLDRATTAKTEVVAREAEMRFARFFNNAPIGIATVDREGRIDSANSAFLAYVEGGAERGTPLADFVAEEDRQSVTECLARVRAGQLSGPAIEVRLKHASERVGQLYANRVDTDDAGASVVVYLTDATEQKSLELQFAQSQKMQAIGQLAGGVAHDFNNLLTAIIGFCDLLLSRHQAGDPSFSDVMQIKQNANRAANLTRQLLAFSRRQTMRPKVLSLTDALAELQNLLSRLLTEKVDLKIVNGRDLGLIKVDQNQLEQVIMNLAVNARDAMPEGGSLTVRTANVSEEDARALDHALMPPAEYLLIEVSDTGVGIEKENIGKIFEPFYTTKDPSKGTGLGLSTVYGIIKQMGGFIFPYSTLNKGTTFRIYLPRYFETAAEAKAEAEAVAAAAAAEPSDLTGKGTILLVEDEDAVRTFAARALSTRGYEVLQAESGEAAIAIVDAFEGKIDLVVSDVVMPNMDGPTMVKALRDKLPGAKIIFISGYAEDAFEKSLDPDQEFHFLPKPFSLKQLASAVKMVLSKG